MTKANVIPGTPLPWKSLAMRAIDCLHDVERETDWGQPTFGPSVWERLRDEQNELLAKENDTCAKARGEA